jgi:hypothetical protein
MIVTRAESSYIICVILILLKYILTVLPTEEIAGPPTAVHEQERQRIYKRNIEVRLWNQCCRGKAKIVTHSECVSVALVIQHAMRMRRIVLSFVARLVLPYFPH